MTSIFLLALSSTLFGFNSLSFAMDLQYVGHADIPAGEKFQGVEIGGISGLSFDFRSGEVLGISDDQGLPRFFRFKIKIAKDHLAIKPVAVTKLESRGDDHEVIDTEGIAITKEQYLYICSEGKGDRVPRTSPGVSLFSGNGRFIKSVSLSDKFLSDNLEPQKKGVSPNRGFESLTLSPSEKYLFAVTESPLIQDIQPVGEIKILRLLQLDLGREIAKEFPYPIESLKTPLNQIIPNGVNGVSDLLAVGEAGLISLERGGAVIADKPYMKVRLYHIEVQGAADISDMSIQNVPASSFVHKSLLLDMENVSALYSSSTPMLDNFEGLTIVKIKGQKFLILVSDNDFKSNKTTRFVAFRIRD